MSPDRLTHTLLPDEPEGDRPRNDWDDYWGPRQEAAFQEAIGPRLDAMLEKKLKAESSKLKGGDYADDNSDVEDRGDRAGGRGDWP